MEEGFARAQAVRRLTWLVGLLLLWGAAIFGKLVHLQVFHHLQYLASATKQQELKIELPAIRGNIYDRNGHPLAMSVAVDSVSVNPLKVPDISVAAEILSQNLNLEREQLFQKLQWCVANHRGYLSVKKKLTPQEAERVRSLPVNWIDFNTVTQRHYPNGQVAAHVIGGVYKQDEGVAGVEKGMNAVLRGKPGLIRMLTDVKRRGIDSRVVDPAEPGSEVVLTIDERIQFIAEREIEAAVKRKSARSGSVVVMNPYTGEVLALANYPTYDPNKPPVKGDDPIARFDLGVSVPFEPGSIFKVMTLAAALETTDLKPGNLIATGGGALRLPGRIVHDTRAHGTITVQEVLEQSSNIGAILIGQRVGREKMNEYVRRFGFGKPSGIALPAESGGLLRKLDHWGTTSLASISMGQEVSATSMQLARACAVIANGGMLVKPKLVMKLGDKVQPTEAPVRILRPQTAITMRQMMEGVVLRGTGARYCKLDGYTSGGKTGSAQIFDTKTGRYTHSYNASFMGFAPVTNPAMIIMVTLNGTLGTAGFGGPAAGPVFKNIAQEALRILDVPKDLPEQMPEEKGKNVLVAADDNDLPLMGLAEGRNILEEDPTATPSGQPFPVADASAVPSDMPLVPDFRGRTVREVVQQSSEMGLAVSLDGSGIARGQLPLPGTVLTAGMKVRVRFRR